ncbi:hypothetical protein Droror1_Dr00007145 [Drosera rotundifolia]
MQDSDDVVSGTREGLSERKWGNAKGKANGVVKKGDVLLTMRGVVTVREDRQEFCNGDRETQVDKYREGKMKGDEGRRKGEGDGM